MRRTLGQPVLTGTYDGVQSHQLPMNLRWCADGGGFPRLPTRPRIQRVHLLPKRSGGIPAASASLPLINLNSYSLSFTGAIHRIAPPSQNPDAIEHWSSQYDLNWTASSNQTWLSVSPSSGPIWNRVGGNLAVSSPRSLSPGSYQGILTISIRMPSITANGSRESDGHASCTAGRNRFYHAHTLGTLRNDFTGWVGIACS